MLRRPGQEGLLKVRNSSNSTGINYWAEEKKGFRIFRRCLRDSHLTDELIFKDTASLPSLPTPLFCFPNLLSKSIPIMVSSSPSPLLLLFFLLLAHSKETQTHQKEWEWEWEWEGRRG